MINQWATKARSFIFTCNSVSFLYIDFHHSYSVLNRSEYSENSEKFLGFIPNACLQKQSLAKWRGLSPRPSGLYTCFVHRFYIFSLPRHCFTGRLLNARNESDVVFLQFQPTVLTVVADCTNGRAYARCVAPICRRLSVAKRCILEQKLLLTAYRKSLIDWHQNE